MGFKRKCLVFFVICMVVGAITFQDVIQQKVECALKHVAEHVVDRIVSETLAYDIPDVNGTEEFFLGNLAYNVTEMNIEKFTKPASAVSVGIRRGLGVSLTGSDIALTGNWAYEINSELLEQKHADKFHLKISGLSLKFVIGMMTNRFGVPIVNVTSCACEMENIDLDLNVEGWVYSQIKMSVLDMTEQGFKDQSCGGLVNIAGYLDWAFRIVTTIAVIVIIRMWTKRTR